MNTLPNDDGRSHSHGNQFSGGVSGGLVQARDGHGSVHLHPGAEPLPPPRQLPGTGALVNQREALGALDQVSASPPGVVVLSGPAGIGKTAVALHWAHNRAAEFSDAQLYADLRGHAAVSPALPGDLLGGFIRGFGVSAARVPVSLAERTALFRSVTAGLRLLIVLDDARSAAQVAPLLPASAGSVAVVTSRWRLGALVARGARGVQLGPLTSDAAMELLDRGLGNDRVAHERDMAVRLAELCAHSPLALSVATARLATRPNWTLRGMVHSLAEERRRLGVLSAPDMEEDMTVRAALALSYRNLPEPVQRLYRLLGLYPGRTFELSSAAALTGAPVDQAGEWLEQLTDANLLDDLPGGRYRFHDLARLHAMETAEEDEPEAECAAALERLATWIAAATLSASRAAAPYRRLPEQPLGPGVPEPLDFDSAATALGWLEREFVNLWSVARSAHGAGLHWTARLIVDAAWPLFLHRGHQAHRLEFDRIGLAAARAGGDREAEAKMLNRTGLALRDLGRLDDAVVEFQAAAVVWRELGNRGRVAGVHRRLGFVENDRGTERRHGCTFVRR